MLHVSHDNTVVKTLSQLLPLGGMSLRNMTYSSGTNYNSFSATVGKTYLVLCIAYASDPSTVSGGTLLSKTSALSAKSTDTMYTRIFLIKATSTTVSISMSNRYSIGYLQLD